MDQSVSRNRFLRGDESIAYLFALKPICANNDMFKFRLSSPSGTLIGVCGPNVRHQTGLQR
jgi:hypothetical protein